MKNHNWILALLCLAASPLNATTVDTSYDTDSMLSWYRGSDESRDAPHNVSNRGRWGDWAARRGWNYNPFWHEKNEASDEDGHYPHRRFMRGHRKIHFTESFEIETAGTYQIYLEDHDHEMLPIDFGIKFTDGYNHHNLDFTKNENGFLFEVMPGEYEISIWAKGYHGFHRGEFSVHISPLDMAPVPVPAAAWLFGSGLLGLLGVVRHKTA